MRLLTVIFRAERRPFLPNNRMSDSSLQTPASALAGRRMLLGVSGSIAAYKAAPLTRLLVQGRGRSAGDSDGEAAAAFVTPLTLGTLSKKPVLTGFLRDAASRRVA